MTGAEGRGREGGGGGGGGLQLFFYKKINFNQ